MANPAVIISEQLNVTKQHNHILKDVTFTLQPGTLTGLIGPSGSGKTTIMRVIIGAQIPSDGTVTVNNIPVGEKELRSRIGYVTQEPAVYKDLTVLQNLRYFGKLVRASKTNIDDTIHLVGLGQQRRQLVATLSGGQRARVSLAIALLGEPEVLVLDEPTVGLDPVLRRHLWKLFRSLAAEGKTLIVSSHVMDEAELCDDILLIRGGRLLWKDTKAGLLATTGTKSVENAFIKLIGDEV